MDTNEMPGRKHFTGSGLAYLINLGPIVCILLDIILPKNQGDPYGSSFPILSGVILTSAILSLSRHIRSAQIILTAGVLLSFAFAARYLYQQPIPAYILIISFALAVFFIFSGGVASDNQELPEARNGGLLVSLSLAAAFNSALLPIFAASLSAASYMAVLASNTLCLLGILRFKLSGQPSLRWIESLALFALALTTLAVLLSYTEWLKEAAFVSFVAPLAGLVLALKSNSKRLMRTFIESWFNHSEGAIVLYFLFLCIIGSLFLAAPLSSRTPLAIIDIIFTSVSAVCITGLATINPALDLSGIGQVFLLLLIQLGGLGIMSFSALAFYFFGRDLSVKHEAAIANVYGSRIKGEMNDVIGSVFRLTFLIEGVGALCLAAAFWAKGYSPSTALWQGLFTSISAFCNAGFSLDADNFMDFQKSPFILYVTSGLVILGGLSPSFLFAVRNLRKRERFNLQNKVILLMTTGLILLGTAMFLAFEWNRGMSGLGSGDKFANAFFFSVISRTAGFNSLDPSALSAATQFSLLFLMFIGGSPGGTAGGIKTTCAAVLASTVFQAIRGQPDTVILKRRIASQTVRRAFSVLMLSLGSIALATLCLLVTQRLTLMAALFEVVSAFATVGLSLNTTPHLDSVGKVIIMVCMFVGRVGPLAILLYVMEHQSPSLAKMPSEEITVA